MWTTTLIGLTCLPYSILGLFYLACPPKPTHRYRFQVIVATVLIDLMVAYYAIDQSLHYKDTDDSKVTVYIFFFLSLIMVGIPLGGATMYLYT